MASRTHIYKGQTIAPCERVAGEHRGRWTVQTYHSSGTPWADEVCPHFVTLAAARESIDEAARHEAEVA